MAIKLDDYLAKLPEERQEAIRKRTAELIAEEATLRRSREAREGSREAAAQAKQALEVKFREAMESGPATPMTPDNWGELERNVRERHRRADETDGPEA